MITLCLITHPHIGQAMLDVCQNTFGKLPLDPILISVPQQRHINPLLTETQTRLNQQLTEEGGLILTDIFGATPSNLALKLETTYPLSIISGLNLPMLFRVMNYANLPLASITEKALSGGTEGIQASKQEARDPC